MLSFEGHPFDPGPDVWEVADRSGPLRFDFAVMPGCDPVLRGRVKSVVLKAVRERPTSFGRRVLRCVRALLRDMAGRSGGHLATCVTAADVRRYQDGLPAKGAARATVLRNALNYWAETGVPGLADDLAGFLHFMDAPAYLAGQAVRTCSPTEGALKSDELDAVLACLDLGHDRGLVKLDDYCIALLLCHLGLRPIQVSLLKVRDLVAPANPGTSALDLLVPRVKVGGGSQCRESFTPRQLAPLLAGLLQEQAGAAIRWAEGHGVGAQDAPMFPSSHGNRSARLPGLEGHLSSKNVSTRARTALNRTAVLSTSTHAGQTFALRLRRTVATLRHAEGASLLEVAHVLDQRAGSTASIYIQPTPELGARVGRALERAYAGLAAGLRSRVPAFDASGSGRGPTSP